jgi:CubicO group peptidase (beta-lactamase class C family)
MNRVRVILAAAALLAAPAWADTVDALVAAARNRDGIPGVALLVMRTGRVERIGTYGLANVEHRVPVTRKTMFQTGSLGKQFTAAAVLLLAERGRLALDDRIDKYLPAGPPGWEAITIRQLLDHTSGIRDSEDGGEIFDLRHEYSDAELIEVLQSFPLDFAPGTRWKYNNSGYILAGIIVTRVSGMFYADFLAREVFRPLGMRTARIISDTDIVPNRAAGYRRTPGGIRNQDFVSAALNATGDGSLYLSLEDWSAWIAALDRRALFSPTSYDAFWGHTRTSTGEVLDHGYCWDHTSIDGHAVLEFDGSWQGFRAAIARDPSTLLTVVVLANLAEAEPERIARAALAASAGWGRH